jgi:hypothetical protein
MRLIMRMIGMKRDTVNTNFLSGHVSAASLALKGARASCPHNEAGGTPTLPSRKRAFGILDNVSGFWQAVFRSLTSETKTA